MDPFRMPRIPGLNDIVSLLQAQTEALAQLPRTLADLNNTMRQLTEATTKARETINSAQRTAERLEKVVAELEEPVRALRPGLERVGRVLDDPAIDTIPDTVRRVSEDVLPLIHTLRQAQSRLGAIGGMLRRHRPEDALPGDDEPGER